ncbi:MAG: MFS transporter [Anaerolineae bacterium]
MSAIPASTIRRITATLFIAQALALAALIASTTISSITGAELGGGEWAAGLPATFTLIGGSLAAYPAGRLMNRAGRRIGLSAGYLCGIFGGLIAGAGVIGNTLPVFLVGMLLLGAAQVISIQARYAAADVSPEHLRARAISTIVFAGTIGAILGPILSPIAGRAAESLGYDELVGPWFVTTGLFVVTLIFINLLLHPDPRDVARTLHQTEESYRRQEASQPARSFRQVMSLPSARLALISLGLAQTIMVGVMTITPVHMTHFNHGLEDIGFVISAHIIGMFGLSMVTGWLTDRWGRRAAIGLGSLLLIAACALAPQDPDTLPLAASLFLLGLGWNLCFVSGSSLLTDVLAVNERAGIQGAADLVVNLASAMGSLGSGLLIASLGFGTLATVGAGLALIVGAAVLKTQRAQPVEVAAANQKTPDFGL